MGSFPGHILPGSFMLILGCWWMFNILRRYCLSTRLKKEQYKNIATFPVVCFPKALQIVHWEAVIKILFCVIGMMGEIGTAFKHIQENYEFYYGNVQHTTMFFFFGLSGVFDLMLYYKVMLPDNTDYVMFCIAFGVECLLFYFHLDGRAELDVHLHRLLIIAIVGCIVSCVLEMKFKKQVIPALARAFFLLLQGTWFYQIAFILYSPFKDAGDWIMEKTDNMPKQRIEQFHDQIMYVTCLFTWHAGGIMLCMLFTGCAFQAFYKCTATSHGYSKPHSVQLLRTNRSTSNTRGHSDSGSE